MKSLKMVVLGVCFLSANACAHDPADTNLTFNASPFVDSDAQANFTSCGFIISVDRPASRSTDGLSLAVKITSGANYNIQIVAGTAKSKLTDTKWTPTPKVIQWIRIGDAAPVVLNPYDLITNKEVGMSSFTTPPEKTLAIFREFDKKSPAVWVKFFEAGDTDIYSGVVKVSDVALTQVRQCLKSMHGG
ncbi:hypothetical protein [Paraburkholderia domus]|uniref:hypothetical protein n=1 Tax=Paraburkholderia domus TaxID=2793075 RepID=UPI0019139AFA|nr:hypothetical protein [Paraburkholderia domus]MBK5066001.1 hypothetical protein [Burkholderia sp. R-70199]CAE6964951.1 hypothetical protein R70199_07615 [Paraburkholderia domus]